MQLTIVVAALVLSISPISALPADAPSDVSFPISNSPLLKRASCQAPGAVNGQCVQYYNDFNCNGKIGQFGPDCGGHCFQYDSFKSVKATGDGTYGTNCEAYSDINCQTKIGETGNSVVVTNQKCFTAPGSSVARSMKCWFKC